MIEDLRARVQMSESQINRLTDIVSRVEETSHQVVGALVGIKEILQEQKDAHKEFRDSVARIWEGIEALKIQQVTNSSSINTLMESRGWMLGGISFVLIAFLGAITTLVMK